MIRAFLPASVIVFWYLGGFDGFLLKQFQPAFRAEAVISVSVVQQLADVFLVHVEPLTLNVGTVISTVRRTLCGLYADPFQILAQLLCRTGNQPRLISVFYPQNELSIVCFGEEIIEQRCSEPTKMQKS